MAPESATLTQTNPFSGQITVEQVEAGTPLVPKFDADDLIPCVATNATNNHVLTLGYTNQKALGQIVEAQESHYWSRSRQYLWLHGASSGFVQEIV